jgi:hypothetical protein
MKKTIAILFITIMASCGSVKQIGKVNMISNRNIERNLDYKPLLNYAGGSNRELRKSRAKTIEQAIDQTVKKVPGGEFLMNVKIYFVKGKYYAAEGDVWGNKL